MSMEEELDRIATALEGISQKLDVFQTKGQVTPDSDASAKTETAAAKKKRETAEKKAAEKKGPTKEDVRDKLGAVQEAADPDAARAILAEFNATSLGKVKEKDYAKVITACEEFLAGDMGAESEEDLLGD